MNLKTTREVAEELGVSPRRVRQLIDDGRLIAENYGGTLLVTLPSLKAEAARRKAKEEK